MKTLFEILSPVMSSEMLIQWFPDGVDDGTFPLTPAAIAALEAAMLLVNPEGKVFARSYNDESGEATLPEAEVEGVQFGNFWVYDCYGLGASDYLHLLVSAGYIGFEFGSTICSGVYAYYSVR